MAAGLANTVSCVFTASARYLRNPDRPATVSSDWPDPGYRSY